MSKKASKKSSVKKKSPSKPAKKPAPKAVKRAPARKPAAKTSAPKAAPSTALRDRAIGLAKFAHGVTTKFANGFTEAQYTAQPVGCKNHLLWTLGHLSATASWLGTLVDGKPHTVPATYEKLFGYNSQPVADATAYPPFAEVRKAFDDSFDRLIASASALDDASLSQPCTADTSGFCSDKLDAVQKCGWHEGWHVGQLADLRRELGLPSAFAS